MNRIAVSHKIEMVAIMMCAGALAAGVDGGEDRRQKAEPAVEAARSDSKNQSAAEDTSPAELKVVEQALKPLLEKLEPKAKIEYRGSSLVVSYLPQNFKIHGRSMSGEISEKPHDALGPSYKGFVLSVHLQPRGEVNQAVTPQTLREPYWETYLDVTPLAKTDKQIYTALAHGSRTERELLDRIRQKLKSLNDAPAKP